MCASAEAMHMGRVTQQHALQSNVCIGGTQACETLASADADLSMNFPILLHFSFILVHFHTFSIMDL